MNIDEYIFYASEVQNLSPDGEIYFCLGRFEDFDIVESDSKKTKIDKVEDWKILTGWCY